MENIQRKLEFDKRHGKGLQYDVLKGEEICVYNGDFVDDCRHGQGTSYTENGFEEHAGQWNKGKFVAGKTYERHQCDTMSSDEENDVEKRSLMTTRQRESLFLADLLKNQPKKEQKVM